MDIPRIGMRTNLWDDPRVAALCDKTGSSEAQVIGGLYWLWAAVKRHGQGGLLQNLPPRQIDRKVGIAGFAEALADIDWLRVEDSGVRVPRIAEHELQDAPAVGPSNSAPMQAPAVQPTQAGLVCRAMRKAGLADVNPSHPELVVLLQAGASEEEFVAAAQDAVHRRRGFMYALAIVKKRREEAAEVAKGLHQGPLPNAVPAPTLPSRDADKTQQYLASQERTPEQIADAAARARAIREARSKSPTGAA
jgi:hypothetical protein